VQEHGQISRRPGLDPDDRHYDRILDRKSRGSIRETLID